MTTDAQSILDHFKPFFHAHGGDFDVVTTTDAGKVSVKLIGECVLCQLKEKTAEGMSNALSNALPHFKGLEVVTD